MGRTKKALKIALIKDWLTSYGGSEEQLYQLHKMYPRAPIYTSVYDRQRLPQFAGADVRTLAVPRWLTRGRHFEKLALWLPHYFKSLDLDQFDVVISVTSGFAKGVRTGPNTKHICICNTPIRFAWGWGGDQRGWLSRLVAPYFRWYDRASSRDVDVFYANSRNVARRIKAVYGRDSQVLYPPVNVDHFQSLRRRQHPTGFVTIGRLVPYKRVDLIVAACTELRVPLTVIGDGPEMKKLRALAGPTVRFPGFTRQPVIDQELATARAFIFAAEEDFGIAPVEAMAAGCPVLAFNQGGARETVVVGQSGRFFEEQTVPSLVAALDSWVDLPAAAVRASAKRFATKYFIDGVRRAVNEI